LNKNLDARALAEDLSLRSDCGVQVAAVLSDNYGIFAWGWNSTGPDGMGLHAEKHVLSRANRKRIEGSKLTVFGRRKKSGGVVFARPCEKFCLPLVIKYGIAVVEFSTKSGWKSFNSQTAKR